MPNPILRSCLRQLPSATPLSSSSCVPNPTSRLFTSPCSSPRSALNQSIPARSSSISPHTRRSASSTPPQSTASSSSSAPSASSIPQQANPWTLRPGQDPREHEAQLRDLQTHLNKKLYRSRQRQISTIGMYAAAAVVFMAGASYAAVPIYRAFCGATGFGGIPTTNRSRMGADRLVPTSSERRITVRFNASKSDILPWTFKPAQTEVTVRPGETALAFYTAQNNADQDVIGISTYNVTPGKIAPYFAKVECFCFEEQKILAGEEVDLPVFFFIDRDILEDPKMDDVEDVVLNYTFFKARRNQKGHSVPDAPQAMVEKASGFEDIVLANPESPGGQGDWAQVGAK